MKRKFNCRRMGSLFLAMGMLGCSSPAVTEQNASVPAPSESTTASSWATFCEMYVSEPIVVNNSALPSAGNVTITMPSGSQLTFGQLTITETGSITSPHDSGVTVTGTWTTLASGAVSEPTTGPSTSSDLDISEFTKVRIADASGAVIRCTPIHARSIPRPTELAPGVYKTAPYSMLVLVPGDIDPHMAFDPGEQFNMPIIEPGLRFEKR